MKYEVWVTDRHGECARFGAAVDAAGLDVLRRVQAFWHGHGLKAEIVPQGTPLSNDREGSFFKHKHPVF